VDKKYLAASPQQRFDLVGFYMGCGGMDPAPGDFFLT
jgi:hypothetical protein